MWGHAPGASQNIVSKIFFSNFKNVIISDFFANIGGATRPPIHAWDVKGVQYIQICIISYHYMASYPPLSYRRNGVHYRLLSTWDLLLALA
jgi:hypothetical protein